MKYSQIFNSTGVAKTEKVVIASAGVVGLGVGGKTDFVDQQLEFMSNAWFAAGGEYGNEGMQDQIHRTAVFIRDIKRTGADYAVISLDIFLPVKQGIDPYGDLYRGNGFDRKFAPNDLNVKTLQYGVVNLDDNTVAGFNYVTVTERIDEDGNVIKAKRDTNKNMYMANFNQPGVTDFITLGAVAVVSNELSFGAPSIDYSATIKIKNKREIESSITLDKFPSYEGYVSINGGNFNPLYREKAIHLNRLF